MRSGCFQQVLQMTLVKVALQMTLVKVASISHQAFLKMLRFITICCVRYRNERISEMPLLSTPLQKSRAASHPPPIDGMSPLRLGYLKMMAA